MRDLRSCPDYGLRPVGLLDDDPGIRSVFGTPVLGTLADLRTRCPRARSIQAIIIAIPSLAPAAHSRLIRAAADTGAHVRYLPSFLSALERVARAADMRTVSFSDLLGRAERRILEPSVQAMLAGARVLVTGAGGSIGQELCRQIRSHDPTSLHMLDHDESNMHTLQLELNGRALLDSAEIVIADIRDETRIRQVFRVGPARCRLPRRRAQAPAAARAAPGRGREDERARHPEPGASGSRARRRGGFC